MNKKQLLIIGIIIIVGIIGLVWFQGVDRQPLPADEANVTTDERGNEQQAPIVAPNEDASTGSPTATVSYTAQGFSPATVTINKGDTVRFINENGGDMWVASAVHPTHTLYAGTSLTEHCTSGAENDAFDQCSVGGDYSFTFDKAGEWKYHNHVYAPHTGSIIVQ